MSTSASSIPAALVNVGPGNSHIDSLSPNSVHPPGPEPLPGYYYYPAHPESSFITLPFHQKAPSQPFSSYSTPENDRIKATHDVAGHSSIFPSAYNYSSQIPPSSEDSHQTHSLSHSYHTERQRQYRLQKLRQKFLQRQQQLHGATDLTYSGTLSRSAEDGRLVGLFWEAYLPNSKPFPDDGAFQVTFSGSVNGMRKLARDNTGLQRALLALGLTTVGKRNQAEWMLEAGFRVYGDALQETAKSIMPHRHWFPEQLLAIRLFSLYEVRPLPPCDKETVLLISHRLCSAQSYRATRQIVGAGCFIAPAKPLL